MDGLAFWSLLWISETDIFVGRATKRMLGCDPARFFTQLSCAVSLWMWKNSPWNHRNHPKIFTKTLGAEYSQFCFLFSSQRFRKGPQPRAGRNPLAPPHLTSPPACGSLIFLLMPQRPAKWWFVPWQGKMWWIPFFPFRLRSEFIQSCSQALWSHVFAPTWSVADHKKVPAHKGAAFRWKIAIKTYYACRWLMMIVWAGMEGAFQKSEHCIIV